MMNRHKCKLCTKSFSNGKALGGHMRSHLLPLPPSKRARHQLNESSASSSSNSQLLQQQQEEEEDKRELLENVLEVTTCALTRENPKKKRKKMMKSVKATDPEFLCAGSSVVQEGGETKSTETPPNPSRKQLDRTDQSPQGIVAPGKEEVPITSESATGSVHMSCVVSDGSRDEEGARCLMMLSMDKWVSLKPLGGRNDRSYPRLKPGASSHSSKPSRAKYKCLFCRKNFRSQKALSGHKAASGKMCRDQNAGDQASASVEKIYECPFCFKVFGSGQALGGHKRSHLLAPSSSTTTTTTEEEAAARGRDNLSSRTLVTVGNCLIDLNSPAPVEDDDFFSGL